MSRELATVHVQYIPADTVDFYLDDFDYISIDGEIERVQSDPNIVRHTTPYEVDAIGISLMLVGLQSSTSAGAGSILCHLYNDSGPEEIYDADAAEWLLDTAAKLRKDGDLSVSFVVAFNCDVEPDTDNWTGYTHGEPYAELTHYCNAETLEWIEVGK